MRFGESYTRVMPVERALMLLADIVGYTKFMRFHRINLAHSQDITRRLLESMVDAVPSLRLVEIEGDAVFLYAPFNQIESRSVSEDALGHTLAMHRAFHARQQWMVERNMCTCEACKRAGTLHVKFVAHLGDVATQTIKKRTKLVGIDVIAAHRMLKNAVPVSEYILMSESVYEHCDSALRGRSVPIDQELEGVGATTSHFIDLDRVALEPLPVADPTFFERLRETVGVVLRCFPRVIGVRRFRAPDRAATA
jgi:class 3 adenylate cyclase